MFDGCSEIVMGLSGGADSVCLFHVLCELRGKYGYNLVAVHVHHGIRGAEADRDMKFCEIFKGQWTFSGRGWQDFKI